MMKTLNTLLAIVCAGAMTAGAQAQDQPSSGSSPETV